MMNSSFEIFIFLNFYTNKYKLHLLILLIL